MKKQLLFALLFGLTMFGCDEAENLEIAAKPGADECVPACQSGETCIEGICEKSCSENSLLCDETCLDPKKLHLAACNKCAENYCDSDGDLSNGCDINTMTDAQNCGKCGNKCKDNEYCADGECKESEACQEGEESCNGRCLDFAQLHLASCDACVENYCDSDGDFINGCDISTMTDAENCGKCGNKCSQGESCDQGVCTKAAETCKDDELLCNGKCLDPVALHLATCDACVDNYCDSDGDLSNGCDIDFMDEDAKNCGACGQACGDGESCKDGVCSSICGDKEIYCDGQCVSKSKLHLSACQTCAKGYGNCDEDMTNGCETNIKTSAKNCGACGNACKDGETCSAGTCKSSCSDTETLCSGTCIDLTAKHLAKCDTCAAGYENCDGDLSNGCEASVSSDAKNCGACGKTCGIGESCVSGACKSTYNAHKRMVVACDGDVLNIREQPDGGSKKLGTFHDYDYFTALGEKNGWYLINYNNQEAWVSGAYSMSACQECASRKAIDEAEKYLWSKTNRCTYQLYTEGIMPNLGYGGGWDNNCANFVTAALMNVGLISAHYDAVYYLRAHCAAGSDGYRQVGFTEAKAGDIWLVKTSSRSHTELVVGTYTHPENGQFRMITIGSTNFNGCNPNTGRGGDYQLVTYTERTQDEAVIFSRQ